MLLLLNVVMGGSSPRTRGTGIGGPLQPAPLRFIPAHAGNSYAPRHRHAQAPVHPRARGEQQYKRITTTNAPGSSPRTRGTVEVVQDEGLPARFIPAHAGNRWQQPARWRPTAVHPRARGEQLHSKHIVVMECGSSPRTRGTGPAPPNEPHHVRFIPAHAGNRCVAASCTDTRPVHPRARGEQQRQVAGDVAVGGSSPRTRGTELRRAESVKRLRFIPAHAGNSRSAPPRPLPKPVHPRARGEQSETTRRRPSPAGSSPRTRGTVPQPGRSRHRQRFIPAHAGNRWSRRVSISPPTVHPRARGEQTSSNLLNC